MPPLWISQRHVVLLLCAVLLALTTVSYLPLWDNDFVDFDDQTLIFDNPEVLQGLTASGFGWAWTTFHSHYWMPITWLSFQFDAQFFSGKNASGQTVLSPAAFHGQNLFWHCGSVLLLFGLWYRLTGARWQSFLVAALFAVHPMHVESVAWAVERKDVLSSFFGILTLWAYVHYLQRPSLERYLGVLTAYALSLLSKPMLITLPFVLLLLDFWPLRRMFTARGAPGTESTPIGAPASLGRLVVEKLPLFVLAVAVSVVTLVARSKTDALVPLSDIPVSARLANAVTAYGWYLYRTFLPMDLAVLYPHPGQNWSIAGVLAGGGALVALSALAVCQAFRRRWLFVGWFWFVGVLFPVIGLAQGGSQAWADRFTYWPHIGLFVALVWAPRELVDRLSIPQSVPAAAGALVLTCLGVLTWIQIGYWRDTSTLWERVLAVTVDNDPAHAHLGQYYEARGQLDLAENHFSEALRLSRNKADYESFLARVLLALGKLDEAAKHARSAVQHNSGLHDAWYHLGLTRLRQGKPDYAIRSFRKVLEIQPTSSDALAGIGLALLRSGKRQEAVEAFQGALKHNPREAEAWHGLGAAYLAEGKLNEAIEALSTALQFKPAMVSAASDLGVALGRCGQWDTAIKYLQTAVKLFEDGERNLAQMNGRVPEPDGIPPAVIYNCRLAFALYQYGDYRKAGAIYRAALARDPQWPKKYTARAWQLATDPDDSVRDPHLAYELVNQAIQASGEPSAGMLDTLAAALAAFGRFAEAVQVEQQALKRAEAGGEGRLAQGIRKRLRLYEQNKTVMMQTLPPISR
jgi:tetratricopeptide (TPR) repeat protein